MKTQTYLHLDDPCNENWNNMTTVEKGRFCDSCATQVMDFTIMTDIEVLQYLSANNGKMCGRIHKDQLQRALLTHEQKKKGLQLMIAGVASLFFSIGKSSAQQKTLNQDAPKASLLQNKQSTIFINQTISTAEQTLKGSIVNAEQSALLNGYIVNPMNHEKVLANKFGQFVMQIPADVNHVLVGAKGFDTRTVPASMLNGIDTTITLTATDTTIKDIGIFDKGDLNGTNIIMGGIRSFTEIEKSDTVITFVKKIFNNAFFKILPNPATKGGVGISIKQAGNYTVQIFDNNSKLIHVQEVVVNGKGEIVQIIFPSCVVKGTYYIRVVDKKTKKQYVDKLLVQ
jgi:hypothetical protein